MLNVKANGKSVTLIDNFIKTETKDNGSFLDVNLARTGNIAQIRCASKMKREILSGTRQNLYQLNLKMVYPLFKRYIMSNSKGFNIEVDTDGILYITPFGGNLEKDDSINFCECFIIRE